MRCRPSSYRTLNRARIQSTKRMKKGWFGDDGMRNAPRRCGRLWGMERTHMDIARDPLDCGAGLESALPATRRMRNENGPAGTAGAQDGEPASPRTSLPVPHTPGVQAILMLTRAHPFG